LRTLPTRMGILDCLLKSCGATKSIHLERDM
jgi:hypothetical protein